MDEIVKKKYKHVTDDEKSDVLFAHKQGLNTPSIALMTGIEISRVRYIIKYYKPKTFWCKVLDFFGLTYD